MGQFHRCLSLAVRFPHPVRVACLKGVEEIKICSFHNNRNVIGESTESEENYPILAQGSGVFIRGVNSVDVRRGKFFCLDPRPDYLEDVIDNTHVVVGRHLSAGGAGFHILEVEHLICAATVTVDVD